MGCNCGGAGVPASTDKFEVVTAAGQTKVFDSEPEARIFATMNQGKVTVKKKG